MKRDTINYHLMSDSDLLRVATERGLYASQAPDRKHLERILLDADAPQADERVSVNASAPTDYRLMSRTDVVALAKERGIKTTNRTTTLEAVDFLEAADGMSEEEQAAQDGVDFDGDTQELTPVDAPEGDKGG